MPLEEYRRKRDARRTPEPVPAADPEPADGPGDRFVIQEHHARRLHWDVRLERAGVLASWAVPKGLPTEPGTVRFAVRTEDHPLEYLDFSGDIPPGEYGAGRMTIWDKGRYTVRKWNDLEVAVVLHGERVGGRYTFLRKGGEKDWLVRRSDPPTDPDWVPLPAAARPMLATRGRLPADDDGWCYQVLFGGTRVIVRVEGGRIELTNAEGDEVTESHPELRGLGPALGSTQAMLDGELDDQGLWVGDVLHLDGRDLTGEPFTRRRELLAGLPLAGPRWRAAPSYDADGAAVLAAATAQGLPAVLAKRADSPYRAGRRSRDWLEIHTSAASAAGSPDKAAPPVASSRPRGTATTVDVAGRKLKLKLTNQDKVLYPLTGFRKRDVLAYYLDVADVMLPHLADRPVTLVRWPDGVDAPSFFEKNVSRHAPSWLRTARVATPGSGRGADFADFPMIDDAAGLAWAANLAALELHVPQWRVGARGARRDPDLMVFDLDPGEGVSIVDCCRVAERIAERLAGDGLTACPRTSGGKGMQLYVPVTVSRAERTSEYAKAVAEELAAEWPQRVVAVMTKARRRSRVFIDWSQNNPAKTTIASYSLRGRGLPTVATPVTWGEVAACRRPEDLRFTAPELPARIAKHGDLMGPLLGTSQRLPR